MNHHLNFLIISIIIIDNSNNNNEGVNAFENLVDDWLNETLNKFVVFEIFLISKLSIIQPVDLLSVIISLSSASLSQ